MNTTKNIKIFINSLTKHHIKKIQINTNNTQILINRSINNTQTLANKIVKTNKVKVKPKTEKIQESKIEKDKNIKKTSGLYSTIISPMVGTFYKSPAPSESAFVEIGDAIKPKQVVCIIEAMKLMNEIESEVKGEVVEVLVKDGDIVDCGQSLMRIKIK